MAFFGLFGKKKKAPTFEYQPYGGYRPPRIDYTDDSGQEVKILRPTQKAVFDTLMRRSQGQDVGYDPARRAAQEALIRNTLAAQEEDQLRSAQGAISASGLSGNPRAYEALAGRVKRDTGRNLENAISRISIEDLGRANEERDVNTQRLQNLNAQNFNQENNAADFDLDVYNAEQGNRRAASQSALAGYQYDTSRDDEAFSDLLGAGLDLASVYLAPATGGASLATNALEKQSGQGIAPNLSTPSFYSDPLKKSKAYRALTF